MKNPLSAIKKYPPKKRKLIYFVIGALSALLIAAVVFAAYPGRVYYIKAFGVKLVPSQDFKVTATEYFRQNDPRWANDTIGHSSRRLGGTGCLIACVATAISDLGVPVTPQELNNKLTQHDGFQGADLIWYKINEAIPEVNYRYSRIFSRETIENDLKQGLMPIVNVKYYKTGVTHWVLIVGAEDGDFLIFDPMDDGFSTMKLSEHGKVYAYRVIEKAN